MRALQIISARVGLEITSLASLPEVFTIEHHGVKYKFEYEPAVVDDYDDIMRHYTCKATDADVTCIIYFRDAKRRVNVGISPVKNGKRGIVRHDYNASLQSKTLQAVEHSILEVLDKHFSQYASARVAIEEEHGPGELPAFIDFDYHGQKFEMYWESRTDEYNYWRFKKPDTYPLWLFVSINDKTKEVKLAICDARKRDPVDRIAAKASGKLLTWRESSIVTLIKQLMDKIKYDELVRA